MEKSKQVKAKHLIFVTQICKSFSYVPCGITAYQHRMKLKVLCDGDGLTLSLSLLFPWVSRIRSLASSVALNCVLYGYIGFVFVLTTLLGYPTGR